MANPIEKEAAGPFAQPAEDSKDTSDVETSSLKDEKHADPIVEEAKSDLPATKETKDVSDVEATSVKDEKAKEDNPDDEDNDDKYPHGMKVVLIMVSLCFAVFIVALVNYGPLSQHLLIAEVDFSGTGSHDHRYSNPSNYR
jgi:hypothetical protein